MPIKAPFNFVPLNTEVYFPEWADQISHDVPFSDGLSGELNLSITAETPILVGGERKREEDGYTHVYFVQSPSGGCYIPGSTLKGTIRSVLEILSNGKMKQCSDTRFPIRDVNIREYRNLLNPDIVHCGWLRMKNEKYILEDCGFPRRLSIFEIDRLLRTDIRNNRLANDTQRTAKWKYDKIGNKSLEVRFVDDPEQATSQQDRRRFVRLVKSGGTAGTIVLTGQPNKRKKYEFVFPHVPNPRTVEVSACVMKDFTDTHLNSTDYNEFRKPQLMSGKRIPIFFFYDRDEIQVDAIGLTSMFKIPSFNSVHDGIRGATNNLLSPKMDLAECMFGKTDDNNGSLKGRVHFGHAMLNGQPNWAEVVNPVLGQPHASYYPLYLRTGLDWDSDSNQFVIAGRKRYPVRRSNRVSPNPAPENADDRNITSKLHPLNRESVFTAKIRYHNLRPVELGALIAAITFDDHDECRHNIGLAKPLGYGKVKIELSGISSEERNDYLRRFRTEMKDYWENDAQPKTELLAMAKGIPEGMDGYFTYMQMSTQGSQNEFLQGKQDGSYLKRFTEITNRR